MTDASGEPSLLVAWLEEDEAGSRPFRAKRLQTLLRTVEVPESGMGFWGGLASAQAFSEMRLAYIHGLYLSTVLLCLMCIEREIAGILHVAGWNPAAKANLEMLLDQARDRRLIADTESAAFNHLRSVRNAYVHYRSFNHPKHWGRRAIASGNDMEGILEQDVLAAITALGAFLGRRSTSS